MSVVRGRKEDLCTRSMNSKLKIFISNQSFDYNLMCDFGLKVIAFSCVLIILTDIYVLLETLQQTSKLKQSYEPDQYFYCVEPLIRFRIAFTIYAINAAAMCLLLTVAMMVFEEFSETCEWFVHLLLEYISIVFGPVMLTLSFIGLIKMPYIM